MIERFNYTFYRDGRIFNSEKRLVKGGIMIDSDKTGKRLHTKEEMMKLIFGIDAETLPELIQEAPTEPTKLDRAKKALSKTVKEPVPELVEKIAPITARNGIKRGRRKGYSISDETRALMISSAKARATTKGCRINGVNYPSVKEAADQLDVNYNTLIGRFNRKAKGYIYI